MLSNKVIPSSGFSTIISPDKSKIVVNYIDILSFHTTTNWGVIGNRILLNKMDYEMLPEIKLDCTILDKVIRHRDNS